MTDPIEEAAKKIREAVTRLAAALNPPTGGKFQNRHSAASDAGTGQTPPTG